MSLHPRFSSARLARSARTPRRQAGFSLLEVLVAFAVLAMSLGLLYQITGSNARTTGQLMGQEQAMTLAESLLVANALVPADGVQAQGESQGFVWQVKSAPFETPVQRSHLDAPKLHELHVLVTWGDHAYELRSVRPERLDLPEAKVDR